MTDRRFRNVVAVDNYAWKARELQKGVFAQPLCQFPPLTEISRTDRLGS